MTAMRALLPVLLVLAMAAAPPARALESAPVVSKRATATLVAEADSLGAGGKVRLGLRLRLAPGWHTYWKNPGDAGVPAEIALRGATAGPIVWPRPQRIAEGPLTSFAYTGEVLLPLTAKMAGPGTVRAHATWLVCETICVPEEGDFSLDLPAGGGTAGAEAPLFSAADAATPRPSPFPASIGADGVLRLAAPGARPVAASFFPDEPGVIDHGAPQVLATDAGGVSLRLTWLKAARPVGGVLVLTDAGGEVAALALNAPLVAGAAAPAAPGFGLALGLAFLGGLILNLMPCVLPVLAMKALALARLGGAARAQVRADAALYTAGVLAAFAALGGATLALGAAGGAAGWGAQFQQPGFVAVLALLMLLIGTNMAGLFEVGGAAAGLGQGLASRGAFFTGLLAVVVATPCTAPFMATALAATLVLPAWQGMGVFLALGLGLAAPYGLLAAAPGLARHLPKPGHWMARLKQGLALPMFATAAWLGWVLWRQAGWVPVAALGLAAVALLGPLGWLGRRQRAGEPGGRAAVASVVAALTAAVLLPVSAALAPAADAAAALPAGAETFSEARLDTLRAAHRPVLVDVSAAWCITCLVNERVALSPAPVRAAFRRGNVAYLVADWTRRDPAITQYLRRFGRNGVPLYVFYPAQGEPVVLPQILTEAEILARLAG